MHLRDNHGEAARLGRLAAEPLTRVREGSGAVVEPQEVRFAHRVEQGDVQGTVSVDVTQEHVACAACPDALTEAEDSRAVVFPDLRARPVDGLDEVSDACKPIPLPSTVSGGRVAIAIPDLNSGVKYFKKPQGS